MTRPTFAPVIAALRHTDTRFPWVGPTADETEAAVVLEALEATHRPRHDSGDNPGGPCAGCGELWPCPAWAFGEQTALLWLGRAADRVYRHATTTIRGAAA